MNDTLLGFKSNILKMSLLQWVSDSMNSLILLRHKFVHFLYQRDRAVTFSSTFHRDQHSLHYHIFSNYYHVTFCTFSCCLTDLTWSSPCLNFLGQRVSVTPFSNNFLKFLTVYSSFSAFIFSRSTAHFL